MHRRTIDQVTFWSMCRSATFCSMHGETADGLCSDSRVEISRGITFWLWTRKLQWTQRKGSGHESQDRKTVIEWMWLVDSYGELKVIGWRLWSNEYYLLIWLNECDLWTAVIEWMWLVDSWCQPAESGSRSVRWWLNPRRKCHWQSSSAPLLCAATRASWSSGNRTHTPNTLWVPIVCLLIWLPSFSFCLSVLFIYSSSVCLLSYSWNYTEWQKCTCLHMLKIWGQLKIEEEYWKFPAGQVKSCMNRQC